MSSRRQTKPGSVTAAPLPTSAAIPISNATPSVRQFQQELNTLSSTLKGKPAPSTSPQSPDELKIASLALDNTDNSDDGRTLEDRLTSPTAATTAAIAALLDRSLALHNGELILQLSSHNLKHKTLVSLLEDPDTSTAVDPFLSVLPHSTVTKIVDTLSLVAKDINAELSIAHNPFDPTTGRIAAHVTPVGKTTVPSCVNDEEVEQKFRGRSLRLLVRRNPDGAQEIQECRVAVVGNVVRDLFPAKSSRACSRERS
ncbi:hypothetical protein T439DRAFT_206754 [Meredithblackwellia eburnea MCA 4105]